MSRPARVLFDLVGPRTLSRFADRCERPMPEQEKLLRRLLHENADSEFGRRHRFDSIHAFSGFQKAVPISEYEDLEPYIDASRHGKPEQLTQARPVFYAMTSGTTGASKYIPVTEASRRAKSRLMRLWLSSLIGDHPDILRGKVLQVTSPEVEEYAPDGTPAGSEGGHAYRNMPRLIRSVYSIPYEVCEIRDYESRYYTLLRLGVLDPITVIGTPNPSTILLLARHLGANTEKVIRDVRDGTLDATFDIEPEIRALIEETLEPDRDRARFLERAASAGGGSLLPRHVWPAMEALACWKGGTVGSYLEPIEAYFPDGLPVRDLGWLSSECRGSVPLADDSDSGPLAIATNVYEFFPADLDVTPHPTDLLTVDQLEESGRYYVYVTTAGGLYRYPMHDILEVTGFHRNTPSVRFVGKRKGILNFTGEKLTESHVLAAVNEALPKKRGGGTFIAAVGRPAAPKRRPSYVFLVEYDTPPHEDAALRAASELEGALSRLNTEYAAKRESGRLGPCVLRVLAPGQYDAFERRAYKEGARDGQFKILRLTDDEAFAAHFDEVVGDYVGATGTP